MKEHAPAFTYKRHRFPPAIIGHAVWRYFRFALSYRDVEHRRHNGLNNRAENAHQPTRERERRMRRFESPGHAQRFLAADGPSASHFRPRRHRLTAAACRATRTERCATWRAVTGTPALA